MYTFAHTHTHPFNIHMSGSDCRGSFCPYSPGRPQRLNYAGHAVAEKRISPPSPGLDPGLFEGSGGGSGSGGGGGGIYRGLKYLHNGPYAKFLNRAHLFLKKGGWGPNIHNM